MSMEKEFFLRTKLIGYLQRLDPATAPKWGKMNVQQMIEHYGGDGIRSASGRLKIEKIISPPENLQRMLEFLMSDKKGSLHEVVSEVVSYEAKKLM